MMKSNTDKKTATFYVSTVGDDRWSGMLMDPNPDASDGPFATLERARVAALTHKRDDAPKGPIAIKVRGGRYYLTETVLFTAEDSGSREFPISYSAFGAEKVTLSGGRKLNNWQTYKGAILRAESGVRGGKWKFRQLFLNGELQTRSRYPKPDPQNPRFSGWESIETPVEKHATTAFCCRPELFERQWAKPAEGEVVVFPTGGWTSNIVPIRCVDASRRTVTLVRSIQNPDRAPWFFPQPLCPGDRFRVENLLEELTEPGEWYLDSEDGVVYFWPPHGSLGANDEVVAPALQTLISIQGAAWLSISGFTFTETLGGDDLHRDGLDGYGPMHTNQGWIYCGDALHLLGAEHCVIERNLFDGVGGNAIFLERYNARNAIRHNEIRHAGANGICLLGNSVRNLVPGYVPEQAVPQLPWIMKKQPLPMFNQVTDNYIHHCGVLNKYVAGVFLGISDGNLIDHNLIEHMPANAINLGQNAFGRNFVEYNDIRYACMELAPSAAIHAWMDNEADEQRVGHVIRFNRIMDTQGLGTDSEGRIVTPHPRAHGIYLDNYTSNCVVAGNLVVRTRGHGLFVHSGKNHLIENNIFVDTVAGAVNFGYGYNPVPGYLTGHWFCRNIVVFTRGDARVYHIVLYGESDEVLSSAEENIFFHGEAGHLNIVETDLRGKIDTKKTSLGEWRQRGYDGSSAVTDPLFVDADRDDYRLNDNSPALRRGFVPIPFHEIGLRPG